MVPDDSGTDVNVISGNDQYFKVLLIAQFTTSVKAAAQPRPGLLRTIYNIKLDDHAPCTLLWPGHFVNQRTHTNWSMENEGLVIVLCIPIVLLLLIKQSELL